MTIKSVNGKNCLGRSHKRVARMIQESGFPLTLRVSNLYVLSEMRRKVVFCYVLVMMKSGSDVQQF